MYMYILYMYNVHVCSSKCLPYTYCIVAYYLAHSTVYTVEPPLSGQNGTKVSLTVTWILPVAENNN